MFRHWVVATTLKPTPHGSEIRREQHLPGHSVHPDLQRDPRRYSLGFANKAQNFEVVAQYQFDFGLRPSVAYLQSKGKDLERGYGDQDILKYVDVGATYYFNKNMSTYVDYKINLLDENDFTRKAADLYRRRGCTGPGLPVLSCKMHNKKAPLAPFLCPV